jgi:hypothetical protein
MITAASKRDERTLLGNVQVAGDVTAQRRRRTVEEHNAAATESVHGIRDLRCVPTAGPGRLRVILVG